MHPSGSLGTLHPTPPLQDQFPGPIPPHSRAAVEASEDRGPLRPAAGQPVGHDVPQPLQDAASGVQVLPEGRVVVPNGGFQRYLQGRE